MFEIDKNELLKLPYVSFIPGDGRTVALTSYYEADAQDWHLYAPYKQGQLIRLKGGEVIKGSYIATEPALGHDVEFPFGTMVLQHMSFPNLLAASGKITHYILQLAAIRESYELGAVPLTHSSGSKASELANAALEYLIIVIRSVYDLLQKFIKASADMVVYLDGSNRRVINKLPDSFAKIPLEADELRTADEIKTKFSLPEPLSAFFAAEGAHFKHIRDLRVSIEHHGNKLPTIFSHDKGLAVPYEEAPWRAFDVWNEESTTDDKWGSLRALIAWLSSQVIDCTTRYSEAFLNSVKVPSEMSPGNRVFLRHPFGARLSDASAVLADPWDVAVDSV